MKPITLKFPEFDFNNRAYGTGVRYDLDIAAKKITQAGELKRLFELGLLPPDFDLMVLTVPLDLEYLNGAQLAQQRDDLAAALRKKSNVLTYNGDPGETADVYFDTYESPFPHSLHDVLSRKGGVQSVNVDVLCDPFARGPKRLLTSATNFSQILGNGEQAEEAWAKVSGTGTVGIYGPALPIGTGTPHSGNKSIGFILIPVGATLEGKRSDPFSLDCSAFSAGVFSCWAMADGDFTNIRVKIGNDSTNYFYEDFVFEIYNGWIPKPDVVWTNLFCNISSMISIGAPNWVNPITYFDISVTSDGLSQSPGSDIYFDDCVLFVPGAPAPYVANLTVDDGNAPCPFKLYMSLDAPVDHIWIGRKADNVASAPLVVNVPTAATGWNAGTLTSGQADCLNGNYYEVSVANTATKLFPAKFALDKCSGVYKVFARFKSLDPGGVTIRRAAQDKNGSVLYGESKIVAANTAHWQIKELGDLSVPLDKPTNEAVPANLFTTVGLEVTGSSATPYAFRVDWLALLGIDGGSIFISLPSTVQHLIFDTITRDGAVVYGSTDGADDNAYSLKQYARGDLEVAEPGDNTFVFLAYDSTTPDAIRSLQLLNQYFEPRYDLLRKA